MVSNWAVDPKIEIIRDIAHFVDKSLIRKIPDFRDKAISGPFAADPCDSSKSVFFAAMPIFETNPVASMPGSDIGPFRRADAYRQSAVKLPISR